MTKDTKVDRLRRWAVRRLPSGALDGVVPKEVAWGGSSLVLLLLAVTPMPDPVRLVAAVCACGIWLVSRTGRSKALQASLCGVSLGTLLFGWGMAVVVVAAGLAVGHSGMGDGYLGMAAAFVVFFGYAATVLLMAVSGLISAVIGVAYAWRGPTKVSR